MYKNWFNIKNHVITFDKFIEHVNSFGDGYLPLQMFIYCILFNHHHFYNNTHIITFIQNINKIYNEKYTLLYILLRKDFKKEREYSDKTNTFKNITFKFDNLLYELIEIIFYQVIRCFINIPFCIPLNVENYSNPKVRIPLILNTLLRLKKSNISFNFETEATVLNISIRLHQLEQFISFLRGEQDIPSYFTKNMIINLLPNIDTCLYKKLNIEQDTLLIVSKSILETSSVELQDYYISCLKDSYPNYTEFNAYLDTLLKPNPEKDSIKVMNLLINLSPVDRQNYIPSVIPVHDNVVILFCNNIKTNGFEKTFNDKLEIYKKLILLQLETEGIELNNKSDLFSDDILNYPINGLIWDYVKNGVYFLPVSDLINNNYINYYTNKPVKLYDSKNTQSETFQKKWTNILRRIIT